MARGAVRDKLSIARLRAARSLRLAVSSWGLLSSSVERLLLVPNDLTVPDPSFRDEFKAGQLTLAGVTVEIGRGSPFDITGADPRWLAEAHGFAWLGHLRAMGGQESVAIARRLAGEWIIRNRRPRGLAWRADILATRTSAWIANAGLLLEGADPRFFRLVMRSLGAQIRRLDAMRHQSAPGLPRTLVLTALVQAALVVGAGDRDIRRLEGELVVELKRQVLLDGCPISRNPMDALHLLVRLLPLRQCYLDRKRDVPEALANSVTASLAFLRRLRLGDGTLARFNGVGRDPETALATVLTFDHSGESPPVGLSPGGYARLEHGNTVIVVDAGRSPALEHAGSMHAGCLSFEMTFGSNAILRNCGASRFGSPGDLAASRATASHNTLSLAARSSARLMRSALLEELLGQSPLTGPTNVGASFTAGDDKSTISADHDGYEVETGLVHFRELSLSTDGLRLQGVDRLGGRTGVMRLLDDIPFAIHFHLAEGVEVRLDADAQSATLWLPATRSQQEAMPWQLRASGGRISVEPSTDYSHGNGRSARQIAIRAVCPGEATVTWTLEAMNRVRRLGSQ
ncbi:MAG TPA: heparinase II/III family protein [Hyphomicrobiaceae bacterium]|nr:heparinase II/III family protein [Hyphomicrobiaceae bacterium]